MKKSLIALAVLASAGIASAQSSVTMYGVFDSTFRHATGSVAKKTELTSGGMSTSRLGFRGTEDLGGGLNASFWLEAGFASDNGTGQASNTSNQAAGATPASQGLAFNRRSTVSLSGGWGEIRLGRDKSAAYLNTEDFDPFGDSGVAATLVAKDLGVAAVTGTRVSNAISYVTPASMGGFYGQAQVFLGENAKPGGATEKDGNGYALRAGFKTGPVNVATSFGTTKLSTGNVKEFNIAGSYDFTVVKLMAQYSADKINSVATNKTRSALIGLTAPVGSQGEIRAAYSRLRADAGAALRPTTSKLSLGYGHKLSKRTQVYAAVARVGNKDGASLALGGATTAANEHSTGYDLGIRHAF